MDEKERLDLLRARMAGPELRSSRAVFVRNSVAQILEATAQAMKEEQGEQDAGASSTRKEAGRSRPDNDGSTPVGAGREAREAGDGGVDDKPESHGGASANQHDEAASLEDLGEEAIEEEVDQAVCEIANSPEHAAELAAVHKKYLNTALSVATHRIVRGRRKVKAMSCSRVRSSHVQDMGVLKDKEVCVDISGAGRVAKLSQTIHKESRNINVRIDQAPSGTVAKTRSQGKGDDLEGDGKFLKIITAWLNAEVATLQATIDLILEYIGTTREPRNRFLVDAILLATIRLFKEFGGGRLMQVFPELEIAIKGGKGTRAPVLIRGLLRDYLISGIMDYAAACLISPLSGISGGNPRTGLKSDDLATLVNVYHLQRQTDSSKQGHICVLEVKRTRTDLKLADHKPQVLAECLACMEHTKATHMTWILTDGETWIFGVLARVKAPGVQTKDTRHEYRCYSTSPCDFISENNLRGSLELLGYWFVTDPKDLEKALVRMARGRQV